MQVLEQQQLFSMQSLDAAVFSFLFQQSRANIQLGPIQRSLGGSFEIPYRRRQAHTKWRQLLSCAFYIYIQKARHQQQQQQPSSTLLSKRSSSVRLFVFSFKNLNILRIGFSVLLQRIPLRRRPNTITLSINAFLNVHIMAYIIDFAYALLLHLS